MSPRIPSRPLEPEDLGINRAGNKPARPRPQNQTSKPKSTAQNAPRSSQRQNQPRRGQKPDGGQPNQRERRGLPPQRRFRDRGGKRTMVEGSFNENAAKSAAQAEPVKMSGADAGILKIIPLGGLSHIGKNMMALEYENDIIIVDAGFMFPRADMPGIDYIIPDTSYLEARKHKVRAILLTHAHLDHVGALPFILPKLNVPVYGARFTNAFVEKMLEEYNLSVSPQFRVIDPDTHQRVQLGAFTVEFVRVVHAIPDPCAVAIDTPVGRLIHTGDWRFDETPIDNRLADRDRFKQLGDEGVLMLMSDSTSCDRPGRTPTERDIEKTFETILRENPKSRVIISSFSSQINRVQIIIDSAKKYHRKIAFVGRSMLSNVELAVKLGYIKLPADMVMRVQDAAKLPDGDQVIISTGNQGEENSALVRMASGEHKDVKLKRGDVVVMSASIIPGNEVQVYNAVDDLMREGAVVLQHVHRDLYGLGIMHVSGHAYREELLEMIKLTRPKYFLPIHGEFHHLVWHGELAKHEGKLAADKVFVVEDGQTIEVRADNGGTAKLGKKIPSGAVLIDGNGVGDVQSVVLRDRLAMGSDGMLVVIATVDRKTGKLMTSPDLISRGFIYMKDNEEILNKSRKIIKNIFETRDVSTPANSLIIKTRMRDELANYLFKITKRSPIVLPVVIEI